MKPLIIGDLIAKFPIIQGGMGVGISLSNLAGAVAACGGIGIISAANIGFMEKLFEESPLKANLQALAHHIKIAKEKALGGIIGVNIMVASNKYEEYVKCSVENEADLIISGAGLPINLPELVNNSKTKIAPIVSSLKAASVILKTWDKRYSKTADMIVVEGPLAGGHLGFKPDVIESYMSNENYDEEIVRIIDFIKSYETKYNKTIPIVFAGGVYDRNDIDHYLSLGCSGVQMATRFVATEECDAHENFKNAYINCKKEDISIVKSPVGMPGRALNNAFIKRTKEEKDTIQKCYSCLLHCDKQNIPYCISKALINAAKGNIEDSLVFCGDTAYRIDKITTVKEIFKELGAI